MTFIRRVYDINILFIFSILTKVGDVTSTWLMVGKYGPSIEANPIIRYFLEQCDSSALVLAFVFHVHAFFCTIIMLMGGKKALLVIGLLLTMVTLINFNVYFEII